MSDEKPGSIEDRKAEHIALCESDAVAFQGKSNLLEEVNLIHDALPELGVDDIDLSTTFADKTLSAPILIAAMTGGIEEADAINRDLATVAEEHGIGFGFGSQRPLLESSTAAGYRVRDVAPNALILGNIGVIQARDSETSELALLVETSQADALCVHLNPAMEVIQAGGDRDFSGALNTISRLVEELEVPIVVKETGCGISRDVGRRLVEIGVKWVDCSGAGGTSWVGVETLRAKATTRELGERFWDWGIPTAASVAQLNGLGLSVCATGGIRNGLEAAKAIALGATCAGIARPLLQARAAGGIQALSEAVAQVLLEIRTAHLLTGARTPTDLQKKPLIVGAPLSRWIPRDSPLSLRCHQ